MEELTGEVELGYVCDTFKSRLALMVWWLSSSCGDQGCCAVSTLRRVRGFRGCPGYRGFQGELGGGGDEAPTDVDSFQVSMCELFVIALKMVHLQNGEWLGQGLWWLDSLLSSSPGSDRSGSKTTSFPKL